MTARRAKFTLFCFAIGLSMLMTQPASAQRLTYDVTGFGAQRVLVSIRGDIPLGVTSNMSADGLSARISAVGVQFVAKDSEKTLPSAVSSVQQVRRGLTTDLVINLLAPADLTVSPGLSELSIFLKFKKEAVLPHETSGTPASGSSSQKAKTKIPLRFLGSSQVTGFGDKTLVAPGLTIVFPDLAGVQPLTSLSSVLHLMAYTWDLFWSALSQQDLKIVRAEGSSSSASSDDEKNRLSGLVDDMTKELVLLHQQLDQAQQELAALKATPTNGQR